jgi:ankyrin repeat protein
MLYTTFSKERVDVAELLLNAGSDPNADMRGVTALHFAARRGYAKLAELLLARGADPYGRADYPLMT